MVGAVPVLENAPDLYMKSASAFMPFLDPRMSGRTMFLETFFRMCWCCANLGHSRRMWFLVSRVSGLHGQAVGSGDAGMKDCLHQQNV